MKEKKGFTLIELLIVVAIIAILAAIAIPNFLAAQVRAKVARGKAEMRTLATALESYQVDYNQYVQFHRVDFSETGLNTWGFGNQFIDPNSYRLKPLTTPISYIASVPKPGPFGQSRNLASAYAYDTYDYVDEKSMIDAQGAATAVNSWGGATWGRAWRLASPGPTGNYLYAYNVFGTPYPANGWPSFYDPSNGTVSNGDIIRFGPTGTLNYAGHIIGDIIDN